MVKGNPPQENEYHRGGCKVKGKGKVKAKVKVKVKVERREVGGEMSNAK